MGFMHWGPRGGCMQACSFRLKKCGGRSRGVACRVGNMQTSSCRLTSRLTRWLEKLSGRIVDMQIQTLKINLTLIYTTHL